MFAIDQQSRLHFASEPFFAEATSRPGASAAEGFGYKPQWSLGFIKSHLHGGLTGCSWDIPYYTLPKIEV